jgi:hypothetical protein
MALTLGRRPLARRAGDGWRSSVRLRLCVAAVTFTLGVVGGALTATQSPSALANHVAHLR